MLIFKKHIIDRYSPLRVYNRKPLLVSVALFIGISLFAAILLNSFSQSQFQRARASAQEFLGSKRGRLEANFNQMLNIPDALSAFVSANKGVDSLYFKELCRVMTRNLPQLINISLAPNNIVAFVYPHKGNEAVLGFNYMDHPLQRIDVQRSMKTHSTILTGPIKLIQGGEAFILRSPVFMGDSLGNNGDYWGMVSMVVDFKGLFEEMEHVANQSPYSLALRGKSPTGKGLVDFYGPNTVFAQHPVLLKIKLPGGDEWEMGAIPHGGWDSSSWGAWHLLLINICAVIVVSLLLYLVLSNHFILKGLYAEKSELLQGLRDNHQNQHRLYRIIAHDLKSPFSSILMIVDFLGQDQIPVSDEKREKLMYGLKKHAYTLKALLDNLLDWSKAQMNDLRFSPSLHGIQDIVDECLDVMQPVSDAKNIEVVTHIPANAEVFADWNMFTTVFRNLLGNAIKFSERGELVNVYVDRLGEDWVFKIVDRGKGISEKVMNTMFTKDNYSTAGTDGEKGTGLGLMICKDFVARHGGDIHAENNSSGKGACFWFTLPIKPVVLPSA